MYITSGVNINRAPGSVIHESACEKDNRGGDIPGFGEIVEREVVHNETFTVLIDVRLCHLSPDESRRHDEGFYILLTVAAGDSTG